jgi:hypothetical protein
MDANVDTGGELDGPKHRYTGNIARFGGLPTSARYRRRVALDESAFDDEIKTLPLVDRSGEEFHLAFHGWKISAIERSNNDNTVFDPGETWVVSGRLFHRAHAYEKFSYACCQAPLGSYEPLVKLQFEHDVAPDVTTVTLVYPLTNAAAASITGEPVQPLDGMATNHNSVEEGLEDLVFSVANASYKWMRHPNFVLISGWAGKNPADFLDPASWALNMLVATSYTSSQQPALYVWTDAHPDASAGDYDANGTVDSIDLDLFDSYLSSHDGESSDGDQLVNGRFLIRNYGPNFSLYDLNDDGVVDGADRLLVSGLRPVPGDADWDGDVDLNDFAHLQRCLSQAPEAAVAVDCRNADLNDDAMVDQADVLIFEACASGPAVAGDPDCAE